MKRLLLMFVGGVALVVGSVMPASAHANTPFAYWACGASRENRDHVIDHAHGYLLTSTVLLSFCVSHDIDTRCEWHAGMDRAGRVTRYAVRCVQIPA